MPINPGQFLTPYQPLSFEGLNQAIRDIQGARFRNAQLQEQIRRTDLQNQQARDQMAARERQAGIAAQQWGAEHQLDLAKQRALEEHRAAGHAEADERQLLARRKAEENVLGQLRQSALQNMSDAELQAFAPQLATLGLSMRRATAAPEPIEMPQPPPGVDPVMFAKQLEEAAVEAAQDAASDQVLEILRGDEVVQTMPLSQIRQAQKGDVSGALGTMAEASSARDRPAFEGAANVAPVLRGTAQERIAQAQAFAEKRLGREAALRAARSGAGRADRSYDTQEVKAGFDRAKTTAGNFKIKEIIDNYATAEGLKAMLEARNGVSDNVVIGYVAKLWNGGRISDADFRVSEGAMSWIQQAKKFFAKGLEGEMPEELRARFVPVADALIRSNTAKFEELNTSLERLRDIQLTPGSQAGVDQFLQSNVVTRLEKARSDIAKIEEDSGKERSREAQSGRSLLQKYGGG